MGGEAGRSKVGTLLSKVLKGKDTSYRPIGHLLPSGLLNFKQTGLMASVVINGGKWK